MITRRGLFSMLSAGAVSGAGRPEMSERPSTVTLRYPVPDCVCGHTMFILAREWEYRGFGRYMVCANRFCANAGKVVLETLYEAVVKAELQRTPDGRIILHGPTDRSPA